MMGMVVIVDMSGFIETSMILGQKLVQTSMEKHLTTTQVSQLPCLTMGQSLLLVPLKMMGMVLEVDMSEFIKTSMILGQKLARISTVNLQQIN